MTTAMCAYNKQNNVVCYCGWSSPLLCVNRP